MPYQPVAEIRGRRYVTLAEASAMLDGLLSPGAIRDLVRAGRVPGAVRAGHRFFIERRYVGELVADMSAGVIPEDSASAPAELDTEAQIGWKSRRGHTVIDGYLDAG